MGGDIPESNSLFERPGIRQQRIKLYTQPWFWYRLGRKLYVAQSSGRTQCTDAGSRHQSTRTREHASLGFRSFPPVRRWLVAPSAITGGQAITWCLSRQTPVVVWQTAYA